MYIKTKQSSDENLYFFFDSFSNVWNPERKTILPTIMPSMLKIIVSSTFIDSKKAWHLGHYLRNRDAGASIRFGSGQFGKVTIISIFRDFFNRGERMEITLQQFILFLFCTGVLRSDDMNYDVYQNIATKEDRIAARNRILFYLKNQALRYVILSAGIQLNENEIDLRQFSNDELSKKHRYKRVDFGTSTSFYLKGPRKDPISSHSVVELKYNNSGWSEEYSPIERDSQVYNLNAYLTLDMVNTPLGKDLASSFQRAMQRTPEKAQDDLLYFGRKLISTHSPNISGIQSDRRIVNSFFGYN